MTTEMFFLLCGLVISIAIFLQGWQKIPADPPQVAQVTLFGKRIPGLVKKEGWRFFLLYPFVQGAILIKMERINFSFLSKKTRTPDKAESEIPVSGTFIPHINLLEQYINSGKEVGIQKQLESKIMERTREWCMGREEGPATWDELNEAQFEATSILIRKIVGDSFEELNSLLAQGLIKEENCLVRIEPKEAQQVPTWVWFLRNSRVIPTKFLTNENIWVENDWQKVKNVENLIFNKYGEPGIIRLKESIEKRRIQIEAIRSGNGKLVIPDLGIILQRLNIGDINVLGEVAKAAEQQAKERMEQRADKTEIKNLIARVKEIILEIGCSPEKALEVFQTERGKVTKNIEEKNFGISKETLDSVLEALKGGKL